MEVFFFDCISIPDSLSLSLSLSFSLSLSPSSLSLSHTHTHTHTLSLSLSLGRKIFCKMCSPSCTSAFDRCTAFCFPDRSLPAAGSCCGICGSPSKIVKRNYPWGSLLLWEIAIPLTLFLFSSLSSSFSIIYALDYKAEDGSISNSRVLITHGEKPWSKKILQSSPKKNAFSENHL